MRYNTGDVLNQARNSVFQIRKTIDSLKEEQSSIKRESQTFANKKVAELVGSADSLKRFLVEDIGWDSHTVDTRFNTELFDYIVALHKPRIEALTEELRFLTEQRANSTIIFNGAREKLSEMEQALVFEENRLSGVSSKHNELERNILERVNGLRFPGDSSLFNGGLITRHIEKPKFWQSLFDGKAVRAYKSLLRQNEVFKQYENELNSSIKDVDKHTRIVKKTKAEVKEAHARVDQAESRKNHYESEYDEKSRELRELNSLYATASRQEGSDLYIKDYCAELIKKHPTMIDYADKYGKIASTLHLLERKKQKLENISARISKVDNLVARRRVYTTPTYDSGRHEDNTLTLLLAYSWLNPLGDTHQIDRELEGAISTLEHMCSAMEVQAEPPSRHSSFGERDSGFGGSDRGGYGGDNRHDDRHDRNDSHCSSRYDNDRNDPPAYESSGPSCGSPNYD